MTWEGSSWLTIVQDDHWSKKIYRPMMIVWWQVLYSSQMILLGVSKRCSVVPKLQTSDYDIVLAENLSFPCIQILESLIYFCSKRTPRVYTALMGKNFGVIAASKIWHLPSLALHDLVFYITALFCHWDAHLGLFSGDFITTLEK